MTINECFRIMGFPDSFRKYSSNGKLYNQIGNAVAIPMIKEVGQEIMNQLI